MAGPWLGKGGFAGFGGFAGLGKSVKEGTVFTPPAETLGLTDEQIAQIQEIQSSATAKIQAIQTELAAKKAELRSLVWQKNPDQSVLTEKYEEIAELSKEIAAIATEAREAFLAVLTPEQQAKYEETPGLGLWGCGKAGMLGRLKDKITRQAKPVSPTNSKNTNLTVKGL